MALKKQGAKFDLFSKIAIGLVVTIIFLFVLLPVGTMILRSFEEGGINVYKSLTDNPYVRQIVLNTIWLGISVGALGTLLGFILAYIQVRVNFKGKKIQHVLNLVPLVSPPFAFATAVIVLFGRSGIISRDIFGLTPTLYGYPGLLLVLTISYFPVAYMNLLGMMRSLDPAIDVRAQVWVRPKAGSSGPSPFRS